MREEQEKTEKTETGTETEARTDSAADNTGINTDKQNSQNADKEEQTEKNKDTRDTATEQSGEKETASENVKMSGKDKKELKRLESELAKKDKQLADSAAKLKESEDKYLRMYAEYDNYRKRSTKEKENLYSDGYGDAIADILPILDNLQRAAAFAESGTDNTSKGVMLTLKCFTDTLAKSKVEAFGDAGDKFDPTMHNAVMHIDDETMGEGEIVEVFSKGYRRGDRILRYAIVKVAN